MEVNQKSNLFDLIIYGSILILSSFVVFFSTPNAAQSLDYNHTPSPEKLRYQTQILHKATVITVDNQGTSHNFITREETLYSALNEAGIKLTSGKVTKPPQHTELSGGDIKVSVIQSNIPVQIIDGNRAYQVVTTNTTVKNILSSCNILLNSKDNVYPGLEKNVNAGAKIVIDRAVPVKIAYGHQTYLLETQAQNVAEVLAEAKQELNLPEGITSHNLDADIYSGQDIAALQIDHDEITEYENISSQTIYQNDYDLPAGEKKVIVTGSNGQKLKKYHVTYENDIEISRELISEEIIIQPIDRVVAVGQRQSAPMPTVSYGNSSGGSVGTASWYYYGNTPSCAHRDYPPGTQLLVTNNSTGAQVVVTVNDYGPATWTGRIIDLNSIAFSAIAPLGQGLVEVTVTPL
ncbi:G5 domain-containing protein [Patescibacteria group bacterium]|nr:G5 domain-containing protein [Patescibacteria group bacterium]